MEVELLLIREQPIRPHSSVSPAAGATPGNIEAAGICSSSIGAIHGVQQRPGE